MLENDEVVIDGVRFLGCSLWSDFDFAGAENRANSMRICERLVNDYKQIRASELDRPLRRRTRVISTSPAALGWRRRLADTTTARRWSSPTTPR